MPPRVSIITPVHNGARTIGETIASVRAQREPSWEHLIIDDGSTDATGALVHAVDEPRLHYLLTPHAGRSQARNHGLDLATGEHVLFLDADDWLLPNALDDHLRFLAAHPEYGASISDGVFSTDSGEVLACFSARRGMVAAGDVLPALIANPGLVGGSLAVMLRAEIARTHHLRFDRAIDIGEDTLFWIDVARCTAVGFVDSVTCRYRWHRDGTTLRAGEGRRNAALWQALRKVANAAYFDALPATVRARFFELVVVELLAEHPDEQERVIESAPFAALATAAQVRLTRLAASAQLLARRDATAAALLDRAARLAPHDATVLALRVLTALDPRLARLAVSLRRLGGRRARDPLWDSDGSPSIAARGRSDG